METLFILITGFLLGFGVIFLLRLKFGKAMYCPRCTKQYWVGVKKQDPACKVCGVSLKLSGAGHKNTRGKKGQGR